MSRIYTPLHAACSATLVVVSLLLGSSLPAQEVAWRYEYDKARQEAAEKGRPLIIDFGTRDCFWCKKLDDNTFRDPTVLATMNEKFIPLKIDAERDAFLTQRLRISSFPTIVLASYDGQILRVIEGFKEAPIFLENLQWVLASQAVPEWMTRDYELASRAIGSSDYVKAIQLLRTVVEDGKERPVQMKARQSLRELEQLAQGRLARARQLVDKGQTTEAMETVTELVKLFSGTQAAAEGGKMLSTLANTQDTKTTQRSKRARELLALVKEDYRTREFLTCLNRCNILVTAFADLPEGLEAAQIVSEIKSNPEWLRDACETLRDQFTALSLSQAEAWLKKGQPQQAVVCLEQIIQQFPNSRHAEAAQIRLAQIQGQPTRPVDFKKP
jgi:thioredoxin-related protein